MMGPVFTRRGAIGAAGGLWLAGRSVARAETSAPGGVVETASGKVRGVRRGDVSVFLGIPYGQDTAAVRFQPARKAAAWTGVRDCAQLGPQAPQMEMIPASVAGPGADMSSPFVKQVMTVFREGMEVGHESEACLVLNVFTPDASARRKRPVMVWLHGGAFAIGSSGDPQYDGTALARRGDVVVVTLNHRLNALGYLYLGALHDDFADSGNVGQLDQVLALEWVRDNIEAFGGDPANVTIFGESGGGSKVGTLMAMPPARGLFHKAIVQSGPAVTMVDRAGAAAVAESTLATLGVAKADVHKLQGLDYRAVIAAARTAAAQSHQRRTLSPVVDGRALPREPFSPDAPEVSREVPLLIGTNHDEGTLFLSADPHFGRMTPDEAQARFRAMLGDKGDAAFATYRALQPDDPPTYWVSALMTDTMMRMDSIRMADRKAAQQAAAVYMYRFDWRTPVLDGAMRSPHGLEVPLVFDNPDKRAALMGPGPEPARLAALMSQAWIDFARSGDPSQPDLAWPRYDVADRRTMIFDVQSRVVADPDRGARKFWQA